MKKSIIGLLAAIFTFGLVLNVNAEAITTASRKKGTVDTNSALGRCQFGIFASLAEYEREIIVERTRAGLQAAKERGKLTGRPIGLSEDAKRKAIAAKRLYENRDYSIDEICRILHIGSKATLYRYLRYEKVRLMNRRNK